MGGVGVAPVNRGEPYKFLGPYAFIRTWGLLKWFQDNVYQEDYDFTIGSHNISSLLRQHTKSIKVGPLNFGTPP